MRHLPKYRILGIDPMYRGFGFAVIEDSSRLLDWGVICCRQKQRRKRNRWTNCLLRFEALLERYQPTAIVVPDWRDKCWRHSLEAKLFIRDVAHIVKKRRIALRTYSQDDVRKAFAPQGARTKDDIAKAIGDQFPELLPLPRPRQSFLAESYRMAIFDAVGLGLTLMHAPQADALNSE